MDPYRARPGGIESLINGLLSQLSDDVVVTLIGTHHGGSPKTVHEDAAAQAATSITFMPAFNSGSTWLGLLSLPDSLRLILGSLRYYRQIALADVIHAHRVETAAAASLLFRKRSVLFIHNDSQGLLGASSDSFWRRLPKLYRWLELRALNTAEAVVLFNGTDLDRLRTIRPDVLRAKSWYDSNTFWFDHAATRQPHTLLWVGRMDAQKDPLLALDVARELRASGLPHIIKMVGDGAMLPQVRKLASQPGYEQAEVLGALNRAEVARLMRTSTGLLMTSQYEGSPVVQAEAGASGCPVIATPEADPDQFIVNGMNGFRAQDRSPKTLASLAVSVGGIEPEACVELAQPRSDQKLARQLAYLGLETEETS